MPLPFQYVNCQSLPDLHGSTNGLRSGSDQDATGCADGSVTDDRSSGRTGRDSPMGCCEGLSRCTGSGCGQVGAHRCCNAILGCGELGGYRDFVRRGSIDSLSQRSGVDLYGVRCSRSGSEVHTGVCDKGTGYSSCSSSICEEEVQCAQEYEQDTCHKHGLRGLGGNGPGRECSIAAGGIAGSAACFAQTSARFGTSVIRVFQVLSYMCLVQDVYDRVSYLFGLSFVRIRRSIHVEGYQFPLYTIFILPYTDTGTGLCRRFAYFGGTLLEWMSTTLAFPFVRMSDTFFLFSHRAGQLSSVVAPPPLGFVKWCISHSTRTVKRSMSFSICGYNYSVITVCHFLGRTCIPLYTTVRVVRARDSTVADIEVNPGPTAAYFVFSTVTNLVVVLSLAYTTLLLVGWQWFTMWLFYLVALKCVERNVVTSGTHVFGLVSRVILSVGAIVLASHIRGMLPVGYQFARARDSTMHDVEVNPGPQQTHIPSWHDNIDYYARRATIGQQLHCYDVRFVLVATGMSLGQLDSAFQSLTSVNACAEYYTGDKIKLHPSGSSAASVAKAFRAVYLELRTDYVSWLRTRYVVDASSLTAIYGFPIPALDDQYAANPDTRLVGPVDSGTSPIREPFVAERVECAACGFLVNPVGHGTRCVPGGHSSDRTHRVKAFIGDALHKLDVRMACIKRGIAVVALTVTTDKYTNGSAQSEYLHRNGLVVPGENVTQSSTRFEAMYAGDFRIRYIRQLREELDKSMEQRTTEYDPDVVFEQMQIDV